MRTRVCSACKRERTSVEFSKGQWTDSTSPVCLGCDDSQALPEKATEEPPAKEQGRLLASGQKRCTRCRAILSVNSFYKDKRRAGGLYSQCKDCHKVQVKGAYILEKGAVCEACGFMPLDPCQLSVDHKDGDHSNDNPANLWTLCFNCHVLKTHKKDVFCKSLQKSVL